MDSLIYLSGVLAVTGCCLLFLRLRDIYERDTAWAALLSETPWRDVPFHADRVEALPPATQRFFSFAIAPGTPLLTVAVLASTARHRGGRPRRCHDLVAAPFGAIHRSMSDGWLPVSGFAMWVRGRFLARSWVLGLVPSRLGRDIDAARLFDLMCLYAILFAPASVLPGSVEWSGAGESTARVVVSASDQRRTIEIDVDAIGQLAAVRVMRTEAEPGERTLPALTAVPRDFADFGGYRLPREVSVGSPGLAELTLTVRRLRHAGPWAGSSHT